MAAVVDYMIKKRDARVETHEGARFLRVRECFIGHDIIRFSYFLIALVDDEAPKQWRRLVVVKKGEHVQGLLTAVYVGEIGDRDLFLFDMGVCAAPGEDAVADDDEPEETVEREGGQR